MGAIVIATPALSDAAATVITGGPTAGSMPLTFLQTTQPSDVARWTDLTQVYAVYDFGAPVTLNLFWLGYGNYTGAATKRLRAATSVANLTNGSATYDSTAQPIWPTSTAWGAWQRTHATWWLGASPQTARYWRTDIVDTGNPAGFVQAGRWYGANAYQAGRGVTLGGEISVDEPVPTSSSASAHTQSAGGQKYPSVRVRTQRQKFALSFMTEAEMLQTMMAITLTRGATQDVLVLLDPDDARNAMAKQLYGTMKTGTPFKYTTFSAATNLPLYDVSCEVEELP